MSTIQCWSRHSISEHHGLKILFWAELNPTQEIDSFQHMPTFRVLCQTYLTPNHGRAGPGQSAAAAEVFA